MAEVEKPWWDDINHPMYDPFHAAIKTQWSYLNDGWPQMHCPIWPGRGLAGEIGTRGYGALRAERPGWWPAVLDVFERILEAEGVAT